MTSRSWIANERAAHRAARRAPVGSHRVRPDSVIVLESTRYQIVTPSDRTGSLNEVVWAMLPVGTEDEAIDEVFATYRALDVPFKWCVWPWSEPADLHDRLLARGTTCWQARGMSRDCGGASGPIVDVRRVASDPDEHAFASVYAAGWGGSPASVAEDVASLRRQDTTELFVAYEDGVPAGVATTRLLGEGAAYLMGAVVLPPFQGRGMYRGLIDARLAHLAASEVPLAVTHAREATSAPILERLGFATEFRYTVHLWTPS